MPPGRVGERSIMANIYYCYAGNRQSILRAVLSPHAGQRLLREHAARYAGDQFPPTSDQAESNFAIVRIFDGEQSPEYRPGFYLLDGQLMRIEEAVHACKT